MCPCIHIGKICTNRYIAPQVFTYINIYLFYLSTSYKRNNEHCDLLPSSGAWSIPNKIAQPNSKMISNDLLISVGGQSLSHSCEKIKMVVLLMASY